jgi:hypothetical protein
MSQAPKRPKPTPLPDLIQEPEVDPKFHVLLPVGVELSTINPKLSDALAGERIELEEGSFVVIKEASMYSKDGSLYARLKIVAENVKQSVQVSGTVFLKCGVTVSTSPPTLSLKDVDFSVETRNVLDSTAAWIRKDAIAQRIEEKLKIDLSSHLNALRDDFNTRYSSLNAGPDLKLVPHIEKLKFEGARIHDNFVIVGFDVSGEINGQIAFKK